MWNILSLLLLLAAPCFSQLSPDPSVIIQTDFSGGLNTYENPLLIEPNESQSLDNVLLDLKNKSIISRSGFTLLNSTNLGDSTSDVNAVYQLYQSNGTKYCVAFSSTTGYYSTDGCQTFTTFVSTLTRNNDVNCDSYNDNLYCVNNQYNFKFTGTASQNVSAMPSQAQYIRVYANRCFVAGVAGNLSRVYYSNLGSCDNWTTSTDYFDVSPNDGDVITGFGQTIFGGLTIFKKYSTWFLQGSPITGTLTEVSPTTGAKNHRSIQTLTGLQVFDSLGPYGSQPGIYGFDGIVVKELSRKLRGDLDGIDTFKQSTNRHAIQTQADWNAGTFSQFALSSNRQIGTMQSSYTATTQQFTADFAAGTMVNLSTSMPEGVMELMLSTLTFTNADFSSGDLTNWTAVGGWTASNTSIPFNKNVCQTGVSLPAGYAISPNCYPTSGGATHTWTFAVEDANGNSIASCNATFSPGPTWTSTCSNWSNFSGSSTQFFTLTADSKLYGKVKIRVTDDSGNYIESISTSNAIYDAIELNWQGATNGCSTGNARTVLSACNQRLFTNSTGTYVSQVYDTYISTPIWGPFSSTFTKVGDATITFGVKSASSPSGNWSILNISSDTLQTYALTHSRYLQFFSTIAISASNQDYGFGYINTENLPAASTGVWTSNPIFLSNNIINGGWGLFTTVQSVIGSSATITYSIKSGTSPTSANNASFTPITPGTTIGISTGAYVVVQANYQMDTASDTALTSNITINWNEGAQASSPSSAIYQGRYHYGAQGKNGKTNNVIYIMDTNGAWVKWDDMYPRSMAIINQNFMMGDASTGTSAGNIYQLYQGNTDNGNPINAFFQTRDFNVGDISHIKSVDKIYLIFNNNPTTLSLDILANGGQLDTNYSVNTSTGFPYSIKVIPVEPAINANSFSLKFSNNAAAQPWGIVGGGMHFTDEGLMQPTP